MSAKTPAVPTGVPTHPERLVLVRRLLEDVSRREVLAAAATTSPSNHVPWIHLGPESGLTEDQRGFIGYWRPSLVLKECRIKRELICALDEWALTTESSNAQDLVGRLLRLIGERDVDDT